jgi:hypothetical protein
VINMCVCKYVCVRECEMEKERERGERERERERALQTPTERERKKREGERPRLLCMPNLQISPSNDRGMARIMREILRRDRGGGTLVHGRYLIQTPS